MGKKKHNIAPGNPNQITISQHIIPVKSIERFYNQKGAVEVRLIKQQKVIPVKANNKLFCASRCWDHHTEVYMTSIENPFQELCEIIIKDGISFKIGDKENKIITKFYSLWRSRHHYQKNPESNWKLKGLPAIDKERDFTQDEREKIEKLGAITPDYDEENGVFIPSHIANGQIIRNSIHYYEMMCKNAKWGILISKEDQEFVMPDCFLQLMAIPVTPKICLFSYEENQHVTNSEVKKINSYAIHFSQDYFFAKDFKYCY